MKYKCSNCGYINDEGCKFCEGCGMPITFQHEEANVEEKQEDLVSKNESSKQNFTNDSFDSLWGKRNEDEKITSKENYFDKNTSLNKKEEGSFCNDNSDNTSSSNTNDILDFSVYDSFDKENREENNSNYDYESNKEINENKTSSEYHNVETAHARNYGESEDERKARKRKFIVDNLNVIKRHLYLDLTVWVLTLGITLLIYFIPFIQVTGTINIENYNGVVYSYDYSLLQLTKDIIQLIKLFIDSSGQSNDLLQYFLQIYTRNILLICFTIYIFALSIISIVKIIKCIRHLNNAKLYGFDLYCKYSKTKESLGRLFLKRVGLRYLIGMICFIILPLINKIPGLNIVPYEYNIKVIYIAIVFALMLGAKITDIVLLKPLRKEIVKMENN